MKEISKYFKKALAVVLSATMVVSGGMMSANAAGEEPLNLIKNPGYETRGAGNKPVDWILNDQVVFLAMPVFAHSDACSVMIDTASPQAKASQNLSMKETGCYKLSVWVNSDGAASPETTLGVRNRYTGEMIKSMPVAVSLNNWQQAELSDIPLEKSSDVEVFIQGTNGARIFVDDWSLVKEDGKEMPPLANLLSFQAEGQIGDIVMDAASKTISLTVSGDTDIKNVKIEASCSEGAAISPASGSLVDFSQGPVKFIVQNEGITNEWIVNCERDILTTEEWCRQELQDLIEKSEAFLSDNRNSALQAKVNKTKALLQGEATIKELVAQVEGLQERYLQATKSSYTYESNSQLVSSFGWEGDIHAPVAYLDGSYQLRDNDNKMITFGVQNIPGKTKISWYNAEGYLPCFISEYSVGELQYKIESFADEVTVKGNRYEIAYSRMSVTNNSDKTHNLPVVHSDLAPLNDAAKNAVNIGPGATVVRDYCIGADRFGHSYAYPSDIELAGADGFDEHYAHMKNYWNSRLEKLVDIKTLPAGYEDLINAYKAGYIYTLIIKDDVPLSDTTVQRELHVGENGYDRVCDHDIIGIMVGLMTLGDFEYFDDYSKTILMNARFPDARWKFSWPFAYYLMKTGDIDTILARFDEIKENVRMIETQRTGDGGIMMNTNAIDSNGSRLVDNWAALMGLTAYGYLCDTLYEKTEDTEYLTESRWAASLYGTLLEATEAKQEKMRTDNDYPCLSIDMNMPTEQSARSDVRDGNWASMFLFGRWGWDGYLFGADQENSEMISLIDGTYAHGFERRSDISDSIYNFGGYPHGYFSSAYNAGYASTALRGEAYRDAGIKAYQWMIDNSMSGPFGWWEGVDYPDASSPWADDHAAGGGGSCQHMWGQSVNTKVLIDSLIAEKSDGTVIIGRGIPEEWITDGETVAIDKYPVSGGRMGYTLESDGKAVTIAFTGDTNREKSVELIALKDNIAYAGGLLFDSAAGTVTVPEDVSEVTVTLGDSEAYQYKTLLKDTIDAAIIAKENYLPNLIPAVKNLFEQALTDAIAVYQKADATVQEIEEADEWLITTMQYLRFTADKESLKAAIDRAKGVAGSGRYLNDDQMKIYKDAITAAETLYNDEWATDTEIDPAVAAMLKAEENLNEAPPIPALDLSKLQREVDISSALNLTLYYDGEAKTEFSKALAQAQKVLTDARAEGTEVTQKMVDDALSALHAARAALRLIPNREALKNLLEDARSRNAKDYTKQSFGVLGAALKIAEAIYSDETATQADIDEAAEVLQAALDNLVESSGSAEDPGKDGPSTNEPGKENPGSDTPTGDAFPLASLGLLTLCCGAALVALRKKSR